MVLLAAPVLPLVVWMAGSGLLLLSAWAGMMFV